MAITRTIMSVHQRIHVSVTNDPIQYLLQGRCCHPVTMDHIDPSHKSHNASNKYPTMHHFLTEMCTHAHFCYKMVHCWIWDRSIVGFMRLVYWRIIASCFDFITSNSSRLSSTRQHHGSWSTLVQARSWCCQAIIILKITATSSREQWVKINYKLFNYNLILCRAYQLRRWNTGPTWILKELTHWGRDKMAAISQTTFTNAFSWMKMYEFYLWFHWSLFLRFELTIFQHWLR